MDGSAVAREDEADHILEVSAKHAEAAEGTVAESGPAPAPVAVEGLDVNEAFEKEVEANAETDEGPSAALIRMQEAGLCGPLRTWVAPLPALSLEAQLEGGRMHVPVPDTMPQEWLCISLGTGDDGN